MKIEEVIELLLNQGYKEDSYSMDDHTRYFYKRLYGATDCHLNERPPSIGISLYEMNLNGKMHESMKINLRAEAANRQWVDVGYYALDLSEIEHLSDYTYTIEKMWECAN